MKTFKSFGKKMLCLVLSLTMVMSCIVTAFAAKNYNYSSSESHDSIRAGFTAGNFQYNSLNWAEYSDEQIASSLVQMLDDLLLGLNMTMDITIMTLDLRGINATMASLEELQGYLDNAIVRAVIGGDVKNANLSALNGMRTYSTSSLTMVCGVLQLVNDNAALISNFVNGTFDLGSLVTGIVGGDLYDLIGLSKDNPILSAIKPLLVGLVYDKGTDAYTAALGKTLDNFVIEDVIGTMVGSADGYTGTGDKDLTSIFPGWSFKQTDSLNTLLLSLFKIVWDDANLFDGGGNNALKDLFNTISVPAQSFEPERKAAENDEEETTPEVKPVIAPGEETEAGQFDRVYLDTGMDVKIDEVFEKILYHEDEATGDMMGVLNLRIAEYTPQFAASTFDFTGYTSLLNGVNDFLGYLFEYMFPTFDNSKWVRTGNAWSTDTILSNALELIKCVGLAITPTFFDETIGGAANLTLNNLQEAMMPLAKAILVEIAPMVHQDTLDKIVDIRTLAQYAIMEYAANVLPDFTYTDSDDFFVIVRDIIAYQSGGTIPIYKNSSGTVHTIYDVYAEGNTEDVWQLINYIVCYYAEDKGIANFFGLKNFNRQTSLWDNVDKVMALLPVFGDLFYDGGKFYSEDFLKNTIIDNILDLNFKPILDKLASAFNSDVIMNRGVWEIIWTNLQTAITKVFPFTTTTNNSGGTPKAIPTYAEIKGTNNSPFENFLTAQSDKNASDQKLGGIIQGLVVSIMARVHPTNDSSMLPGLAWVLKAVSSLIPGFMDELEEQDLELTSASLATNTITGTRAVSTSMKITNNSFGSRRQRTVLVNGVETKVRDEKYKSIVKSITPSNSGVTVAYTPNTTLDHGASMTATLGGTASADGVVTVTVVYDILGEDGSVVYSNLEAVDFLYVNSTQSYYDSMYNADGTFKTGAATATTPKFGSGPDLTMKYPTSIVLDPSTFDTLSKYKVQYANSTNIGGGSKSVDCVFAWDATGYTGTRTGTVSESNMAAVKSRILVNKTISTDDGLEYWADINGNPMDGKHSCTPTSGYYVTTEPTTFKETSVLSTESLQVADLESGIPGIKLDMRKYKIDKNTSIYVSLFKWDGKTEVQPGQYTVNVCFYNSTSSALIELNITIADTNGTLANQKLEADPAANTTPVEVFTFGETTLENGIVMPTMSSEMVDTVLNSSKQPIVAKNLDGVVVGAATKYYGLTELASLYADCKDIYSSYNKSDFTDAAVYDHFYSKLINALAAASYPVNSTNWDKIAIDYATEAYINLRYARDELMNHVSSAMNDVVDSVLATKYNEVNYKLYTYYYGVNAASTAVSLRDSGTASSFEITEALRQYELAAERMIFRGADKTNLKTEIDRSSDLNEADYSAESWLRYSSHLAKAETVYYDTATVYKQSEVNGYRERLMIAENLLAEAGNPVVDSIAVTTMPTSTTVVREGTPNFSGIVVTGTQTDGTEIDVTSEVTYSYSTAVKGTTTVTVTLMVDGKAVTTTFEIDVTPKMYTVTFYDDESADYYPNVIGTPQVVEEGTAAVDPTAGLTNLQINEMFPVPFADGYIFTGWSANFTNVQKNMDIYITCTNPTYTLTYAGCEDAVGKPDNRTFKPNTAAFSLSTNLERDGYTFIGWYISEDAKEALTVFNPGAYRGNVTLTARWEEKAVGTGHTVSGYVGAMVNKSSTSVNLALNNKAFISGLTVVLYDEYGAVAVEGIDAVSSDGTGSFTIENVPSGNYTLVISGPTALTRYVAVTVGDGDAVVCTQENAIGIVNCNIANTDQIIGPADYIAFLAYLNTYVTEATVGLDFNGDGTIDPSDYTAFLGFINADGSIYAEIDAKSN